MSKGMACFFSRRRKKAPVVSDRGFVSVQERWCRLFPFAGEFYQRFHVFFASFPHNLFGERRGRGSFVPVKGLQVIAEELFVEGGLGAARLVAVFRPEAAGVGGHTFVDDSTPKFAHMNGRENKKNPPINGAL